MIRNIKLGMRKRLHIINNAFNSKKVLTYQNYFYFCT